MNKKKAVMVKATIAAVFTAAVIITVCIISNNIKKQKQYEENMKLGSTYMERLDFEAAIKAYKKALDADDKGAEAYVMLAISYEGISDYENAERYYKKALDAEGSEYVIRAYEELAELYIMLENPDEAKELLEDAMKDISNERITALYDKTHPVSPAPDYEEGTYNERIRISFDTNKGEKLYVTTDGSEPDEEDACNAPVILRNGSNEVRVKVINERGYESETAVYVYNITIEDKIIEFEDKAVEKAVRALLSIPDNEPVYNDDAAMITELTFAGKYCCGSTKAAGITVSADGYTGGMEYYTGSIQSLNDLRHMPFLEEFGIIDVIGCDITGLAAAKGLKALSLRHMELTDVSVLAGLGKLETLCLADNKISNIFPVGNLNGLKSLGIWNNDISDISALAGLTELEYFDISGNKVIDISVVSGMTELEELWAYNNNIKDISALSGLKALKVVMLRNNPLDGTEVLKQIFPRLERCDVKIFTKEAGK